MAWQDGDEKLSQGAQTYIRYYDSQYDIAASVDGVTDAEIEKARAEYDKKQDSIRTLDSKGLVEGNILNVPVYNQLDTVTKNGNQLCWATSAAMVLSYRVGDTTDRTLEIAQTAIGSTKNNYNRANTWQSTVGVAARLGITLGDNVLEQTETNGLLTEQQLKSSLNAGNPVGVRYGGEAVGDVGHYVVIVGYASATGHQSLVVSNDPSGGVQNIQTYDDFKTYNNGSKDILWSRSAR